MRKHAPAAIALLLCAYVTALGQQSNDREPPKIEVGVHFSSFTLGPDAEFFSSTTDHARSEDGAGVRAGYNLTKYLAVEGEVNFFTHEQAITFRSGGNLLQGQFGAKIGKRFDRFGFFAKGRPGFLNFSQVLTHTGNTSFTSGGQTFTFPNFEVKRRSFFSLDVGGVVEFYPSRRVLVRFDFGDTMVHTSDVEVPTLGVISRGGLSHKFQFSSGIAFRFLQPESSDDVGPSSSSGERKFEIGAQFSSLALREFEYSLNPATPNLSFFTDKNTQSGFGGRFTYHFIRSVGVEVQADIYPGNLGNFGGRTAGGSIFQLQAGGKVGKRFEKFGLFGKARPGIVSFSDTLVFNGFNSGPLFRTDRSTYFSLDVGGVAEFYPSPQVVARFDAGDTMIRYGGAELGLQFIPAVPSPPAPWEFKHNFQFSAGVGFRF